MHPFKNVLADQLSTSSHEQTLFYEGYMGI